MPVNQILLVAGRMLPEAEALLAEAVRNVAKGFIPPVPFTMDRWRQNVELSRKPIAAAA